MTWAEIVQERHVSIGRLGKVICHGAAREDKMLRVFQKIVWMRQRVHVKCIREECKVKEGQAYHAMLRTWNLFQRAMAIEVFFKIKAL